MGLISRFAIQNLPSTCAHCGQPFKQNREQDLYAWRSSSGKVFCSEFCADVRFDERDVETESWSHH